MAVTDSVPDQGSCVLSHRRPCAHSRQVRAIQDASHAALAEGAQAQEVPWWLWWNILSGDAPTVALAWALVFTRASGGRLSVAEAITVVLSVWIIYVSDHLLDSCTRTDQAGLAERHLFCSRHRFPLIGLVAVAGAVIFWLTTCRLHVVEMIAGVELGLILLLYMAIIHAARGRVVWALPKEIAVGFLFAFGTALPCWSKSAGFSWANGFPCFLFALLCSLNCVSIECWENHRRGGVWRQPPNPLVHWADSRINSIAAVLACGAMAASLWEGPRGSSSSSLLPVSLGALLLLLLNCARNRLSERSLRVLADVALVVPALIALVVRG
jgi:hypothetical protein